MVAQVSRSRRGLNHSESDFDAIVVGSGATGGVAAMALAQRGLKTLVLEAGPQLKGARSYGSSLTNLARRLKTHWLTRRQTVQEWHGGYWETNPDLFVDDRDNPYSTSADKPYLWIRGRQVGGRSHTWGGVCLRFSDLELGGWPIGYQDIEPFYGRLEKVLEVHGAKDHLPGLPDGEFLEPGHLSPGERHLQSDLRQKFNRSLVISRGIRAGRRAARGEEYSRLSSNQTTLARAIATGRVTIESDAVVHQILFDPVQSAATGVEVINTKNGAVYQKQAKLVVLCASSIETIRLLLNSRSGTFPQGIGADSGLLGKGIMDHIATVGYFYLPDIPETSGYPLLGSEGAIIPRFGNGSRGYGYWGGVSRLDFPRTLRKDPRPALGFFCGMGEALQSDTNNVTLDPNLKDKWGIPAARINYSWLDEDLKLAALMRNDLAEMIGGSGGKLASLTEVVRTPLLKSFMTEFDRKWAISIPGAFVHEVGGARMGEHRSKSVTNRFGQIWDCSNIIVGDGAVFPSSAWQNPTLTEMALCLRACENAVDQLKKGEI